MKFSEKRMIGTDRKNSFAGYSPANLWILWSPCCAEQFSLGCFFPGCYLSSPRSFGNYAKIKQADIILMTSVFDSEGFKFSFSADFKMM